MNSPRTLLLALALAPLMVALPSWAQPPPAEQELQNVVAAAQASIEEVVASPALEPMVAESNSTQASAVMEQMEALLVDLKSLQTLSGGIAGAPTIDQQALIFRRDERNFALIAGADRVAGLIVGLPQEDPDRAELQQALTTALQGVPEAIGPRLKELDDAIAAQIDKLGGQSGLDRITTETYINGLMDVRFKYFESLVNHLETRGRLGLPTDELKRRFEHYFYLQAESVSGRLQFVESARSDLQRRLDADPTNTDLDVSVRRLNERHGSQLEVLSMLVDLMERLKLDTTTYKSLLVQGGPVSVSMIERGVVQELLRQWFDSTSETLKENAPDIAVRSVLFLLVLFAFRILSRLSKRLVRTAMERSNLDLSQLLKETLVSFSGGFVMIIGVLMALSQIGISIAPMLAGLGIAGFIVGFALQDTLGNFAAGAMILIYRPYDVDDFVEVTGASGEVKKMNLVSTTITTFDNQTLVVPNSRIWGDVIKNVTAQNVRRVDMVFGIGYGDDIEQAERIFHSIVDEHELTLKSPAPMIHLHNLGESSVDFIVRPWTKTSDYWTVYWDIMREVKMRFDREGISIPFPQRDVHVYREDKETPA